MSLIADGQINEAEPQHVLNGGAPFYSLYETADGRHMAVGALEPAFFAILVELLDLVDVCPDQADVGAYDRMRALFAARFLEATQAEWSELFEGTDACVAPVLSLTEAASHPHLKARQVFTANQGVLAPAPAPRFSRTAGVSALRTQTTAQTNSSALHSNLRQSWNVPEIDAQLSHRLPLETTDRSWRDQS